MVLLNLTSVNAELRLLSFPGETIKLQLDVDQEVQLNFEKPLSSIGIPDEIKNNIKTQLIDSRIWIKATKAFKPTRVLIKSVKGEISVFFNQSFGRIKRLCHKSSQSNVIFPCLNFYFFLTTAFICLPPL
jgi:hypothetical protein